MDAKELQVKLLEAQELMQQEKYREALVLLEELKEVEKNGDFDYNLTHKLYQLISNSKSLYNQQLILNRINEISQNQHSISIYDLNFRLKEMDNIVLDLSILRREIELLILRALLKCQIQDEVLLFSK